MGELVALDPFHPDFPDPLSALEHPDGLLAVGGNLLPDTLTTAYRHGIFPWFEDAQPILWWSPSIRAVIRPGDIHISRSLAKKIRRQDFLITTDQAFESVVAQCAETRRDSLGTWITGEMQHAYLRMHRLQLAHSVEVWHDKQLVGGLYGVVAGGVFCGESMFSLQPDASKIALVSLAHTLFSQDFRLIDCQLQNPHLESMGAVELPRNQYLSALEQWRNHAVNWPQTFFINR